MKSVDELLNLLKNVISTGPNKSKWKACCPAHHDGDHKGEQSLSIDVQGEKILLHCFAGCKTTDIVKALDLKMSDLFIGEKIKPVAAPKKTSARRKIVATYQYLDISNKLIFEVVRYDPKAFSQRRPDGKGGYIYDLNGIDRVIYRLPLVTAAIGRGETIFHVEGEKDADNLVKLGFEATTSPQGAASWKSTMAGYYNGAKLVVIIPDKDEIKVLNPLKAKSISHNIWTAECPCLDCKNKAILTITLTPETGQLIIKSSANCDVEKILGSVGLELKDLKLPGIAYAREVARDLFTHVGAVKILELPGDNVKDASDWIAAGGTAAQLEELVKNAPDWQLPADQAGVIDYDDLNKTLKAASNGLYIVKDQRFQRLVHVKDEINEYPLCNFVARVIQDIVKDSGTTSERFLRIHGRLNGSHLPLVTVADNQFDNMNWIRREWGVKAQIERNIDKVERHINQAIIKSSGRVPEKVIYTHTGWREIDGQMVYLTNGGAIGRLDIEVELPTNLARYNLPQPDGDPREAIQKSMDLVNVAESKVTLPLLILPYLAVLNVFEDINFTPWLIGRSGSLKSVMTALALSHFGNFTEKTLPANWFGTRTELEKLAFHAKDILFNIDDFAPPAGNAQKKELNNTAEYILRAYGNRQARVRSRADLTSQVTFIPRGLLLSSGEEMPAAGVSRSARTLPIPIAKEDFQHAGDNDYFMLTQAQKDRHFYPLAMAHYIRWIQKNWKDVGSRFREYLAQYRSQAPKNTDTHLRLIDAVSMMQSGYRIMLEWAVDMKAIPASSIVDMLPEGWGILTSLLDYQSTRITAERPGERFIEVLRALLSSGRILFRHRGPEGWIPKESGPGQIIAGWDDLETDVLFINPNEAYAAVYRRCEDMKEYFGSSRDATWQDLHALGYLKEIGEEGSRTFTKKKRFDGLQQRVLYLDRKVIYAEDN